MFQQSGLNFTSNIIGRIHAFVIGSVLQLGAGNGLGANFYSTDTLATGVKLLSLGAVLLF